MWEFLRPGISQDIAAEVLGGILLGLGNVGEPHDGSTSMGSSPEMWMLLGDPAEIATSYMMWVEEAEAALLRLYKNRALAGGLHTDRYWRIRDIGLDNTERPTEMVVAERDYQSDRLNNLLAQLEEFRLALAHQEDESFILLDTNVLLHGLLFTEVDWSKFVDARNASIILPLAVIDELDKIKDSGRTAAKNARATLREIHTLLGSSDERMGPFRVRDRVTLRLVPEPDNHIRLPRMDDEIVRQVGYFNAVTDGRVKIVTRDRGMSVRASFAFLPCEMLPSHLERSPSADISL